MEVERSIDNSLVRWFLWWRVPQAELKRQIEGYATLRFFATARGLSVLLLGFAVLITAAVAVTSGDMQTYIYDIVIMVCLMIPGTLGKKWAFIGMMIYWTVAKVFTALGGVVITEGEGAATGVSSVLWSLLFWTVFMHAFYLAYLVEKKRHEPHVEPETKVDIDDELQKLEKLAALRSSGVLTEEEFLERKRRIMGTAGASSSDRVDHSNERPA